MVTPNDTWWKAHAVHLKAVAREPVSLRSAAGVVDDCITLCKAVNRWSRDYHEICTAIRNFLGTGATGASNLRPLLEETRGVWLEEEVKLAMRGLHLVQFLSNYNLTILSLGPNTRMWAPTTLERRAAGNGDIIPRMVADLAEWNDRIESIVRRQRADGLRPTSHAVRPLEMPEPPGFQFDNEHTFFCFDSQGSWKHYPYSSLSLEQIQGVLRYFVANAGRLLVDWTFQRPAKYSQFSTPDAKTWLKTRPSVVKLVREHFARENLPADLYTEFEPIILKVVEESRKQVADRTRSEIKQNAAREQIQVAIRKRVEIVPEESSRELHL